jgi:hypothetical protein
MLVAMNETKEAAPSPIDENVSMNIRLMLTLLGKKGTYVAKPLGMHRATWSQRMTNDTRWMLSEVCGAAEVLGVSVDTLVMDPEEASPALFEAARRLKAEEGDS